MLTADKGDLEDNVGRGVLLGAESGDASLGLSCCGSMLDPCLRASLSFCRLIKNLGQMDF